MGIPNLDYDNPLHTFINALTYIAVNDCYLHGVYLPYNNKLVINGKEMCNYTSSSGFIPLTWKISTGDIVTVQNPVSSLYILSEK